MIQRAFSSLLALALPVLAGALGCVVADPEPSRAAQRIVGGTATSADDAVVAVIGTVDDATYLCSGVLVAPRTVLTAAHCVHQRDSIDVVFADDIDAPETVVAEIAAVSWAKHADWLATPTDHFDRHYDLGMVLLETDAPSTPVLVNRIPLDASLIGAEVRLIGYGDTHNGAYDSGQRREATTTLRSFDDWWTTAGGYDANTCVGDSGGPQLMQLGGAEVIAGVTSFGTAPANEELCRFDTIAARVDIAAAELIDAFIAENDTPGPCGEDGACSQACATPAQDPDCRDLCVSDGHCEPSCGDFDPDCQNPAPPDAAPLEQRDAGDPPGDDPDGGSGGGCAAGTASGRPASAWWLLVLVSFLAGPGRTRRRRPRLRTFTRRRS